jgi:hypothetical protein
MTERADLILVREDDSLVRLGRVLAELEAGAKAIRRGVRAGSPPGALRQPLDEDEHDGHWLTRRQVMDAINAASEVESIIRRLYVRMDPRCKGELGFDDGRGRCRCVLPRDHEGRDHACDHEGDTSGRIDIYLRNGAAETSPDSRGRSADAETVLLGPGVDA